MEDLTTQLIKISESLKDITADRWSMVTALATVLLGIVAILPIIIEYFRDQARFAGAIRIEIASNGVFSIKNTWTKSITIMNIKQTIRTIDFSDKKFITGPYNEIDPLVEQRNRAINFSVYKSNQKKFESYFFDELQKGVDKSNISTNQSLKITLSPNEDIVFGKTFTNRLPKQMSGALGYIVETEIGYARNIGDKKKEVKKYLHYYSMFIDPSDNWVRRS